MRRVAEASSRAPREAAVDAFRNRAYALIIGVGAYVHAAPLPPTLGEGAAQLAAILGDPAIGGYRPEQITLLTDGAATQEAIREALGALSTVEPDATVFLYFAGHGGRAGDAQADDAVYFLPVEADDARSASLAATAISGADLAAALRAIPAARWLAVFDCCHAGGLGDVRSPRGLAASVPSAYYADLAGRGRVVIASSRADERSWIEDASHPSVFTRHLLAALRGGARPSGRWLRAWELFEYVQPRVTIDQPDQHPVLQADLEENFPIALYLGGVRGADGGPAHARDGVYHAYLSYADEEPDATRVWRQLVPQLERAGLEIAVSGDVEEPGVHRVVGMQRGVETSRRTVVVLSDRYFGDRMARFIDVLAQTRGLEDGIARLIPVYFDDFDPDQLPLRLRTLVSLDLGHRHRAARNVARLVRTLSEPHIVRAPRIAG
ncbi:MAG: caspase family protein [Acidobacteriota bacterium]